MPALPLLLLFLSLTMGVTVWWLKDPTGIETRCAVVPAENESCDLTLEQENQIIHSEHHENLDVALLRANAMWIECQLDGWTEP